MHDDEAKLCILTTIRTESYEKFPSAEELTDAILDALLHEGLIVVRNADTESSAKRELR